MRSLALGQSFHGLVNIRHRVAQPIEPSDDQGISGPKGFQHFLALGAPQDCGLLAGGAGIDENRLEAAAQLLGLLRHFRDLAFGKLLLFQ